MNFLDFNFIFPLPIHIHIFQGVGLHRNVCVRKKTVMCESFFFTQPTKPNYPAYFLAYLSERQRENEYPIYETVENGE